MKRDDHDRIGAIGRPLGACITGEQIRPARAAIACAIAAISAGLGCEFPIPADYVLNTREHVSLRFMRDIDVGSGIILVYESPPDWSGADAELLAASTRGDLEIEQLRVRPRLGRDVEPRTQPAPVAVIHGGSTYLVIYGPDSNLAETMADRCSKGAR